MKESKKVKVKVVMCVWVCECEREREREKKRERERERDRQTDRPDETSNRMVRLKKKRSSSQKSLSRAFTIKHC